MRRDLQMRASITAAHSSPATRKEVGRRALLRGALAAMLLGSLSTALAARGRPAFRPVAQVHLFRGIFGIDGGISALRDVLRRNGVAAVAYDLGQEGGLIESIAAAEQASGLHAPVVLIGYSLGGETVIELSYRLGQAGIPVDLLVTLDAPAPMPIPANVRQALNLYQTQGGLALGRPVSVSASFRGQVVNENLDRLPNINHDDFVYRPEVIAMVVRQVMQTLRR